MELSPLASKRKGGNRTASPPSHGVYHVAPNIIASQVPPYKEPHTSQSNTSTCENPINPSQIGDAHNKSDTVRSPSTGYTLRNNHKGKIPYRPLTSRVLYKHNLQQAHISRRPESRHASQHGILGVLGAAVLSTDNLMHGLYDGGTGGFNDNLLDPPYQTQSQQHSTASMYNEADRDAPNYQSVSQSQSRSVCQDNAMDIPESDMFDVNPLSWDLDQDHEITAWGNSLSGIGEHLADHTYQEYTNYNDLVAD